MSTERLTEAVTVGHLTVEPLPGPGNRVRASCAGCGVAGDFGERFGPLTQGDLIAGFAETHAAHAKKKAK